MSENECFELLVHVDAEQWSYYQRRSIFLEALLLRVVRQRQHIQEWYDAQQLAALRLPGLPHTAAAISRKASTSRWPRRQVTADGPQRYQYHVTTLPARAFDALIGRMLEPPQLGAEIRPLIDLPLPKVRAEIAKFPSVTAPSWVLPLMRLVKGEARGDFGRAWMQLPAYMPAGVDLPSIEEAAGVLVDLGLAERIAR